MMNSQMDQLWKNDQKVINLIFVQNCDKWFHNCKVPQKYSLMLDKFDQFVYHFDSETNLVTQVKQQKNQMNNKNDS